MLPKAKDRSNNGEGRAICQGPNGTIAGIRGFPATPLHCLGRPGITFFLPEDITNLTEMGLSCEHSLGHGLAV